MSQRKKMSSLEKEKEYSSYDLKDERKIMFRAVSLH